MLCLRPGFPCDQFLGQEPDDEAAIDNFVCSAFHITFPMFSKVDVNGANTHPLFQYLKVRPSLRRVLRGLQHG